MQFNKERMEFSVSSAREELTLAAGILVAPGFVWALFSVLHYFLDAK